jgi:aspartate racemase
VDFAEIEALQRSARWQDADREMADAAESLEKAGADCVLICANTMHKCAPAVETRVHIPLLHIADAAAHAIQAVGIQTVGLLGTRFTMNEDFYKSRLAEKFSLHVLLPSIPDREIVDRVIFEELVLGKLLPESKKEYLRIIQELAYAGAGGIILGCTEIGLLVQQVDCAVTLFDTTYLHAAAAVDFALS